MAVAVEVAVVLVVVVVKVADFIMIIQILQSCPTRCSEIMNGKFVRNQHITQNIKTIFC